MNYCKIVKFYKCKVHEQKTLQRGCEFFSVDDINASRCEWLSGSLCLFDEAHDKANEKYKARVEDVRKELLGLIDSI